MKHIFAVLLVLFSLVACAEAKRAVPKEVEPLSYGDVKIVASASVADMGFIEIRDQRTDRLLLKKKVYDVSIDPSLETDVQWVFIASMTIADDVLKIVDERERTYKLDMKDLLDEAGRG